MKFPREIFLNSRGDCEWLATSHLKELELPAFKSFVLYGSESSPIRFDLYEQAKPEYNHQPHYVLVLGEDGEWWEA